jgi:capsular polysaccharide biosynthesis protein
MFTSLLLVALSSIVTALSQEFTRPVIHRVKRNLQSLTQEPKTAVKTPKTPEPNSPSSSLDQGELAHAGIKRTRNGYTAIYIHYPGRGNQA